MKKIAVLAGDGIGPEIMAQALKVLTALKLPLEFEEALVRFLPRLLNLLKRAMPFFSVP